VNAALLLELSRPICNIDPRDGRQLFCAVWSWENCSVRHGGLVFYRRALWAICWGIRRNRDQQPMPKRQGRSGFAGRHRRCQSFIGAGILLYPLLTKRIGVKPTPRRLRVCAARSLCAQRIAAGFSVSDPAGRNGDPGPKMFPVADVGPYSHDCRIYVPWGWRSEGACAPSLGFCRLSSFWDSSRSMAASFSPFLYRECRDALAMCSKAVCARHDAIGLPNTDHGCGQG